MENSKLYTDMVSALAKSGVDIIATLTPTMANGWHMATGVAGEAGELLDAVKKYAVYNNPLDRANVIEELGDLEFYMEGLRQGFGITREETLVGNMEKLAVRYSSGKYSDKQAQDRADKNEYSEPTGTSDMEVVATAAVIYAVASDDNNSSSGE